MERVTLVQTIGNLEEFYEFRDKKALPLALKLHRNQVDALNIKSFNHFPSSINVSYLYKIALRANEEEEYVTLWENSLGELVENCKIYIPEFIDIDANRRYIDYITKTYHSAREDSDEANFLCTDYRHKILYRDKKRLFESLGKNTDFVRGQFTENPCTIDFSDLLKETLEYPEKVEQNKQKIKSLL